MFHGTPACLKYESDSGCKYGDKCKLLHTEAGGQPSKKSKKGGVKGSAASLKETVQFGCVSKDCLEKVILRDNEKLGSNHAVKFSKGTWHQIEIRERKGPSQEVMQKCIPLERIPGGPKFEERTQDETLRQERCARGVVWNLAKDVYKLTKESQHTVLKSGDVRTLFEKSKGT